MNKKNIPIKKIETEIETLEQHYKSLIHKIEEITGVREKAVKQALDVKGQYKALTKLLE